MNSIIITEDIKRIISNYLSVNKNTVKEINKINLQKINFFGRYCGWKSMNLTFTPTNFKEYIDYLYREYEFYPQLFD